MYCTNDCIFTAAKINDRSFYDFVSPEDEANVRQWIDISKGWGISDSGHPCDSGFVFGSFKVSLNGRDSAQGWVSPSYVPRRCANVMTAIIGIHVSVGGEILMPLLLRRIMDPRKKMRFLLTPFSQRILMASLLSCEERSNSFSLVKRYCISSLIFGRSRIAMLGVGHVRVLSASVGSVYGCVVIVTVWEV